MGPNAERLAEVYDAFWKRGDWRAGLDIIHPDIEWINPNEAVFGSPTRGATAVGEFFRDWLEAWEHYTNDCEVFEVTPDLIVVESHFQGVGKGSGIVSEMHIGQVWEFRDGLAVRQQMFRTPGEAHRAAAGLLRESEPTS